MSGKKEKILSLTSVNLASKSDNELQTIFNSVLDNGMHGLCFSPYLDGQKPGDIITEEQIRRRMEVIKPYTKWIRTFSCTDGNELIPQIAHEYGIKTLVGAWLGKSKSINDKEIKNIIQVAKDGYADIIAIGNEVMYRGDLSEDELLEYMLEVKKETLNVPIAYVDAYYEFENRPKITDACDVILANCYPFWEGCKMDYSLLYMKDMYRRVLKAANGKKVIISETGWPNIGEPFHGAEPSHKNALMYFINTQLWSEEEDIDIFYFSSFDESWKTSDEGDVGAYWGIWDSNDKLKFS
jgi:glucan 1,3-beta-glucosidase